MSTNTLSNFSIYLWSNPEGYQVTLTTNFGLPSEKRKFLSFGNQTYKSWKAYNLHQPEALKEYFSEFKESQQRSLKTLDCEYWISKLAENTGDNGRRVARGAMILLKTNQQEYFFIFKLGEFLFKGEFDPSGLSPKQIKGAKGSCLGQYLWKDNQNLEDYAEAF